MLIVMRKQNQSPFRSAIESESQHFYLCFVFLLSRNFELGRKHRPLFFGFLPFYNLFEHNSFSPIFYHYDPQMSSVLFTGFHISRTRNSHCQGTDFWVHVWNHYSGVAVGRYCFHHFVKNLMTRKPNQENAIGVELQYGIKNISKQRIRCSLYYISTHIPLLAKWRISVVM